jgi:CysZ protein
MSDSSSKASAAPTVQLGSGPRGFFTGIGAVLKGLSRLVREKSLRGLAVAPLLIAIITYVMALVFSGVYVDDLVSTLWAKPEAGYMLYVWYVLVPVVYVALVAVLALMFVSFAGVISGPFYEKMVNQVLSDHGIKSSDPGIIKGTMYEISRSLVFVVPAMLCALMGLIPVVGVPFIIAGTLIGWLGLASMAMNPTLVATKHSLRQQIRFPVQSLGVMLGVGLVLGVSVVVPVLGLLVLPSAVIGVADLYGVRATKKLESPSKS